MFEIAKTAARLRQHSHHPGQLQRRQRRVPGGSLIADANGDLFGTTDWRRRERLRHGVRDRQDRRPATPARPPPWSPSTTPTALSRRRPDRRRQGRPVRHDEDGGANGDGTVFEIVKTAARLRQHPDHAGQLQRPDGATPLGRPDRRRQRRPVRHDRLAAARTATARCSRSPRLPAATRPPPPRWSPSTAPTALPDGSLIADANGNLFGTTTGGANDDGTVFEIVKIAARSTPAPRPRWSASTAPTAPSRCGGLIADANGDLFGTTAAAAPATPTNGTVFKITKTRCAVYASTPTTLVSFKGLQRSSTPYAGLIADANGDLFGTTSCRAARTTKARCSRSRRPATAAL